MKFDFRNPKFLFFLPLFFVVLYELMIYNNNFSMNGAEYEVFFWEIILASIIYIGIEVLFYLLFFKIISNKHILAIMELLFWVCAMSGTVSRVLFCVATVLVIIFKKPNHIVTSFCEIICILLSLMACFLLGYNNILAIYTGVSFTLRNHHYKEDYKVVVDEQKESPNIYWIHMDGMPNLDFVNKYYQRDMSTYQTSLEEKGFIVNPSASFVANHHTIVALNALYNPNYYDHFFKEYLQELEKCGKRCATKDSVSFKDSTYIRFNNEFFTSFKAKGYRTVSIAEFNQYTSMDADYIYDIYEIEHARKIKYFKNDYKQDELYKYILKVHRKRFTYEKLKYDLSKKDIELSFQNEKYPWLQKTEFLPMKAIMTSLEDAYNKDSQPTLYFIDNTILHLGWDYGENGELLSSSTNLDYFDEAYIYALKLLDETVEYIKEQDPNGVIVVQGDHGIHFISEDILKEYYHASDEEVSQMYNATISAIYIPQEYKNGEEEVLDNPLNISRYLVNNFVGENYEYLK